MESYNIEKYMKAQKRVGAIKKFYTDLMSFLFFSGMLILFHGAVIRIIGNVGLDDNMVSWLDWNIKLIPLWWGIILLIRALCIFKFKFGFIEKWEQRQIEKYMK